MLQYIQVLSPVSSWHVILLWSLGKVECLIGSAAQRDNEPDLPKPSTSPPQNNTHCEIVSLVYCPTTMGIA